MNNKNVKSLGIILCMAVVFLAVVFVGISLTKNVGKTEKEITKEEAGSSLKKVLDDIDVENVEARKSSIKLTETSLAEELPEIDKYPLSVEGKGEVNIEIFSSPEKAGEGTDGWLIEVAESFNKAGIKVNGKSASVSVRSMASGLGADYIISGKHLPDAFTPSNELWGEMILAQGGNITLEEKRLVGNVAGIIVSEDEKNKLTKKYGSVNMKTITEATANNEIAMGYTDPLASTTGINFLLSTLFAYDDSDLLSEKATAGFKTFQTNVPFVAYTTMQMRDAVKSGSLNGLILEYQTYVNTKDLKSYSFTPFGVRHDNPMYRVGKLSKDKQEALKQFNAYCLNSESQELATEYGFNQLDKYKTELPKINGETISSAQKLWKENKDTGKDITAVFVSDISGSMDGEPINQLKKSLINASSYINEKNSIGLVSFNSNVYINLPIGKFDINQKALFTGAVEDLQAMGGTASYDGVAVAVDMLVKAKEQNPNTKLMLFLLSDGQTNGGHSLKDVKGILESYKIPVYTIGYGDEADLDELARISEINEAASISADSEDVIYKLKSLFNSQM